MNFDHVFEKQMKKRLSLKAHQYRHENLAISLTWHRNDMQKISHYNTV